MQEITQKMKRYLIELIKIFAITEVVVVIAYFLVVVTGFNIISLSQEPYFVNYRLYDE